MHPVEPARASPPARVPLRRAPRFAPVSDEPSTALRVATGYFTITGALTVVSGVGGLVAAAVVGIGRVPVWLVAGAGAATVLVGVGAIWTGRLLARKRRRGGVVAIATLLAPVAQWALGHGPAVGVLVSLAGAVVVASVWNELE